MYRHDIANRLLVALSLQLLSLPSASAAETSYTPPIAAASPDAARALEGFRVPEGMTAELAAAEPRVANPVAFTVRADGSVLVCETFRQKQGVEDNRGHMDWLLQDLQLESIEERVAMFRRFMGADAANWETEHDRIRLLRDTDGDGVFDADTIFADGFSNLEDGTGAGVLEHEGRVYYTCIPKLWSLSDADGDGVAEEQTALHHGYGVRVAFRGHDLHGLTLGPDGRIYFSLGDRGYNVITQEGSRLKRPDTGAVFRCFPDGSHLEVFAYGLRNPQELAFDNDGNLFTGDNNSDSGDQARWVYVVQEGDTGWRMYFQYLDDRGPWNRERIWYPWKADAETTAVQPASTLPPVANLGNGPSGMTFYPGTGLGDRYNDHFFLADFRGVTATSGIWSFAVEPKGASFEVADKHEFLWSILATDLDFAPDGSLLVSDWVNGWDGEGKGRLYRFADTAASGGMAQEVSRLLTVTLADMPDADLADLLTHVDRRVRQRAQGELASRGGVSTLMQAAHSDNPFGSRHGLWGLWQVGLSGVNEAITVTTDLHTLLTDGGLSEEMQAQTLKVLADIWQHHGESALPSPVKTLVAGSCKSRLGSENLRLAGFAAAAAGVFGESETAVALLGLLDRLENSDPVARHQAVIGLVHLATRHPGLIESLVASNHPGNAGRLGITLALRRLENPLIATMLTDVDPLVVAEAARAINDEPIDAATAALADLLASGQDLANPVLRRALNAAYRRGELRDAEAVASVAAVASVSEEVRVVAAGLLNTWNMPEPLDSVTGRWRPLSPRSVDGLAQGISPVLPSLLAGPPALREMALRVAVTLNIRDLAPRLEEVFAESAGEPTLRETAFKALLALTDRKSQLIERGLRDNAESIRLAAVEELAMDRPLQALPKLEELIASESSVAIQRALQIVQAIGERGPGTKTASSGKRPPKGGNPALAAKRESLLLQAFARQQEGSLPAECLLDLLEAAGSLESDAVAARVSTIRGQQEAAQAQSGSQVDLFSECLSGGDPVRGRGIFFGGSASSCRRCHQVAGVGGDVGPQLSGIAATKDRRYLLESIVAPSAAIAKGFETAVVLTADGVVVSGIVREETESELTLITPEGTLITVATDDIDDRSIGLSGMPADFPNYLSRREIRDLVAYLSSLREPPPSSH